MDSLFLPSEESITGSRIFNVNILKYSFKIEENNANKKKRKLETVEVLVYPDTTVWVTDFTNIYNEPMTNMYFWHKSFDDYPVVGVTWSQAKAYCDWKTKKENREGNGRWFRRNKTSLVQPYKLPTSEQWEYAARGGLESVDYPWGDGSMFNKKDNLLANFKPRSGNYTVDGGMYTTEIKSYPPNDYELYDMAGNVAEWTEDSYDVSSSYFGTSLNSSSDEERGSLKEVRGGAWKDVKKYLKVWEVDYEYKDTARSYIGFRTVQASPQIKRKK